MKNLQVLLVQHLGPGKCYKQQTDNQKNHTLFGKLKCSHKNSVKYFLFVFVPFDIINIRFISTKPFIDINRSIHQI